MDSGRGMPVACLIQLDTGPVIKIFDILEGQDMSNCQLFNPGLLPLSDKCDGTRNPGKMTWGAAARLSSFQELFFFLRDSIRKGQQRHSTCEQTTVLGPIPPFHLSTSLLVSQQTARWFTCVRKSCHISSSTNTAASTTVSSRATC